MLQNSSIVSRLDTEIAQHHKKDSKTMDMKVTGRYFIHSRSGDRRYPLICRLGNYPRKDRLLLSDAPIGANIAPFRLGLQAPIPRRPLLADHHKMPGPVVSDKIKDAIEAIVAESSEFVPAQIEMPDGIFPYWLIHSLRTSDVLDREHSKFHTTDFGSIAWIDELFIDYAKLAEIKKEERMLFQLKGSSVVWLWHEDVVRAIQQTGATGISFSPAEGYSQDNIFRS
jgi:hypothetical protein